MRAGVILRLSGVVGGLLTCWSVCTKEARSTVEVQCFRRHVAIMSEKVSADLDFIKMRQVRQVWSESVELMGVVAGGLGEAVSTHIAVPLWLILKRDSVVAPYNCRNN